LLLLLVICVLIIILVLIIIIIIIVVVMVVVVVVVVTSGGVVQPQIPQRNSRVGNGCRRGRGKRLGEGDVVRPGGGALQVRCGVREAGG
jgi:uncharacterized membrane protein YqiK